MDLFIACYIFSCVCACVYTCIEMDGKIIIDKIFVSRTEYLVKKIKYIYK